MNQHQIRAELEKILLYVSDLVNLLAVDDNVPEIHAPTNERRRIQVWEKTSGHCVYCDAPVAHPHVSKNSGAKDRMFVDHLVPKRHGGPNHVINYVPACQACNSAKGDRDPVEFVEKLRWDDRAPNFVKDSK